MEATRTVVCFGDSNTYGAVPTLARTGRHRFAANRRWPGVMRRQLGAGWTVIEEGHPSRTTVWSDPIEGAHKNGLTALPISLDSHMPVDLVILMLGTNDLKHRFSAMAGDIADSIEVLIKAVRNSEAGPGGQGPEVLVVCPPPIQEVDWFGEMFAGGAAKSAELGVRIGQAAARQGVAYVDAGTIVETSTVDGIHLESDLHRILGLALAKAVEAVFARVRKGRRA